MTDDKTPGGRGGRESDTGAPPAGDGSRTIVVSDHVRADGVRLTISVTVPGELPSAAQELLDQLTESLLTGGGWEELR